MKVIHLVTLLLKRFQRCQKVGQYKEQTPRLTLVVQADVIEHEVLCYVPKGVWKMGNLHCSSASTIFTFCLSALCSLSLKPKGVSVVLYYITTTYYTLFVYLVSGV